MSLFGNSPEKIPDPEKKPSAPPPAPASTPPDAPTMMKGWDAYGRLIHIPREEWRTKVLPANFKDAWDKPDDLASLIHSALNDGFIADCLEPARQLLRIDTRPKRGAIFLGVVLLQLKQFDEAGQVINEALRQHGPDGVLLTNLAKVQSGLGQNALAESTLWHALEVDPNFDNSLSWYQTIFRERGGDEAEFDALRRVAALPGSWRPQLWLARAALQSRQLEAALALYQESLAHAARPVPADLLQQMSGDLGNAAHLPELLRLAEPLFSPNFHGFQVGNNLIKAHLDLGQFDAARKILDQLFAQNRDDWKEHLSYWDNEIARARVAVSQPDEDQEMQITMLTIDGPVWLKPTSPAAELFPAPGGSLVKIAFLGCSAEVATDSQRIEHQMADAPGRMSRALPLFLAEQMMFNSNAQVQTLVPWIAGDPPGFVLSGGPWEDDDAANYARQAETKSDYVVSIHLKLVTDPWTAELRLVRTIDTQCLGTLTASWPAAQPEAGIPELARQLLGLLAEHAETAASAAPPSYSVPTAAHFGNYLLRLEQLLAVRCGGMDGVPGNFLNGEREIIDGTLQLCLDEPRNVSARILLAQTLTDMKRVRPDILPEFKDKIALLPKDQPLAEPVHSVIQRIIDAAFA